MADNAEAAIREARDTAIQSLHGALIQTKRHMMQ